MKQQLKRLLGDYYTPRLRHLKRQFEIRALGKGEAELALLPKILDRTHIALDVGANIGDYLGLMARYSKRVIAFEPHPACFADLQLSGIANCTLLNIALSDRAGSAVLKVPVDAGEITGLGTIEATNTSYASTTSHVQDYEIKTARLDDVAVDQLRDGERIGFIKIDVEGHEHAVLVGAEATIDKHRPIVMVETEYRHGAPIDQIFALFTGRDYVAKVLLDGKIQDVDPTRLAELQREIGIGDMVKDAKDSIYVNNVWFVPSERVAAMARLSRAA